MPKLTLACPIRVAVIEAEGLTVTEASGAYEALEACAARYRARYATRGVTSPGEVDGIQVTRSLYRALGIDPTKTRPSSEALLRRVLKDKPLYHVSDLVDVGNWVSLDFLLSLGLYDRDAIRGDVELRSGRPGEQYEGINKPPVHVEGRYVLCDAAGPFGSPTSDSARTAITLATTSCLMVLFAPGEYDPTQLAEQGAVAAERIVAHCGGRITRRELLDGTARS